MAGTGPEHELVRMPTLEALLGKGWSREQIICPSPDSEDAEWHVPQSPHDASKREQGLSFKPWPVDLVIFDSPEHVGEWDHVFGIFEFKAPDIEAGRILKDRICGGQLVARAEPSKIQLHQIRALAKHQANVFCAGHVEVGTI